MLFVIDIDIGIREFHFQFLAVLDARSIGAPVMNSRKNLEVLGILVGVIGILALAGVVVNDALILVDFANRALAIEPGNLNAIQILAAERYTQGDYVGALNFIDQSGADVSQNKDLMLIKILIHETQGNLELAEQTFRDLIASHPDDNEVRIDVRTEAEVAEKKIPNSINIDIYKGQGFVYQLEELDKSKNYYVYCRSGARSEKACNIMNQLGFDNAYNLLGGILEWTGDVE